MILEVKNGSFSYGNTQILKNISFSLEDKKIMTILGPNGVGKTTLLKCIMNFIHWDKGETYISGRSLKSYKDTELWKKLSYVPQAKKSAFSYRVLDMVVMGLNTETGFLHIPGHKEYECAQDMLKLLGVEKLSNRYCNELSGGELQMVMMARALVSKPDLLILDEPESNLDMKNQLRILNAIERASYEMNAACLINTHFPDHALQISDQTLLLGYGQDLLFGPTKELISEENVQRFFQVRSQIISFQVDNQSYRTIFPYRIDSKEETINESEKSLQNQSCKELLQSGA